MLTRNCRKMAFHSLVLHARCQKRTGEQTAGSSNTTLSFRRAVKVNEENSLDLVGNPTIQCIISADVLHKNVNKSTQENTPNAVRTSLYRQSSDSDFRLMKFCFVARRTLNALHGRPICYRTVTVSLCVYIASRCSINFAEQIDLVFGKEVTLCLHDTIIKKFGYFRTCPGLLTQRMIVFLLICHGTSSVTIFVVWAFTGRVIRRCDSFTASVIPSNNDDDWYLSENKHDFINIQHAHCGLVGSDCKK